MRRTGPGLAALDRSLHSSAQYLSLGSELTASQLQELRSQLDIFSNALRQFAQQHRKDIVRDPDFRHAFQQMCANIGVDPLAGGPPRSIAATTLGGGSGGGKLAGLWNDFLGLSDFQNELSIQIIDVCVSTRESNGGFIDMRQLVSAINRLRTGHDESTLLMAAQKNPDVASGLVTEEDVMQSIRLLKPLGSGYEVVHLANGVKIVRSVPKELDTDSTVVMALLAAPKTSRLPLDALGQAYVTEHDLVQDMPEANKSRWSLERAHAVLFGMSIGDGLLWVDEAAHPARYYALNVSSDRMQIPHRRAR